MPLELKILFCLKPSLVVRSLVKNGGSAGHLSFISHLLDSNFHCQRNSPFQKSLVQMPRRCAASLNTEHTRPHSKKWLFSTSRLFDLIYLTRNITAVEQKCEPHMKAVWDRKNVSVMWAEMKGYDTHRLNASRNGSNFTFNWLNLMKLFHHTSAILFW